MEIQVLTLVAPEADLTDLLNKNLPPGGPIKNLTVHVVEGAVKIGGKYSVALLPVPFETTWEPSVRNGAVHVRLTGVKVIGLPGGVLKGTIMGAMSKLATTVPGLTVEEEGLTLDVNLLVRQRGLPLKMKLSAVRCLAGKILVEV